MVYVHADSERARVLGELHLIPYLAAIRVGLDDADSLRPGLCDAGEHVVLHHAGEVQDVQLCRRGRILLEPRQLPPREAVQVGECRGHHRHIELCAEEVCPGVGDHGINEPFLYQDAVHVTGGDDVRIRNPIVFHQVPPSAHPCTSRIPRLCAGAPV